MCRKQTARRRFDTFWGARYDGRKMNRIKVWLYALAILAAGTVWLLRRRAL